MLLIGLLMACSSSDDPQGFSEACDTPVSLTAQATSTQSAVLGWTQSGANIYRVEYGEAGFNVGSGTQTSTTELALTINGLSAETLYQYYVLADCGEFQSMLAGPVTFETPACPPVTGIVVDEFSITANGAQVYWDGTQVNDFELEYGPAGFVLGEGTRVASNSNLYELSGLSPDTAYEVYVRSKCGNSFSLFAGPVAFTTQAVCPTPLDFEGAEVGSDYLILTWFTNDFYLFELEYGPEGFEPGDGTTITVDAQYAKFYSLESATSYDFYIRTNCGLDGFSNRLGPLTLTTNP